MGMKRIISRLGKLAKHSKPTKVKALPEPPSETTAEDSPSEPVGYTAKHDAPLEKFAPEIRLYLLSALNLDQLSSLIRASPIFYRDFRRSRRSVLPRCLQVTLKSFHVTVDAYAAYQSSSSVFLGTRDCNKVRQFIQSYRSSTYDSHVTKHLTQDEVVRMAAFYSSTIRPLARYYIHWALTNLSEETKASPDQELLSIAEETRVLRALYRFQLCCNLFGAGRLQRSIIPRFERLEILELLFCLFEPWEVEEIACINDFAEHRFKRIIEDIRWDLHEDNPKFDGQRPPTPVGSFDLDLHDDLYLEGTISRGLDLLHTVIFRVSHHAELVQIMQAELTTSGGIFGSSPFGVLSLYAQEDLRDRGYSQGGHSPYELKQQRRDPLPFTGDGDSETEGSRPPLAWTVIWGGTYSNLVGDYIVPDFHRWGYVMWDAARLERTGAKELLARQWEENNRNRVSDFCDPRDLVSLSVS